MCWAATPYGSYQLLNFFMAACQSQVAMLSVEVDHLEQISSVAFENRLKMKLEAMAVDTEGIAEGNRCRLASRSWRPV